MNIIEIWKNELLVICCDINRNNIYFCILFLNTFNIINKWNIWYDWEQQIINIYAQLIYNKNNDNIVNNSICDFVVKCKWKIF